MARSRESGLQMDWLDKTVITGLLATCIGSTVYGLTTLPDSSASSTPPLPQAKSAECYDFTGSPFLDRENGIALASGAGIITARCVEIASAER